MLKALVSLLTSISLNLITICAYSQGELPVNMFKGIPGISVPIHNIVSEGISDGVSLEYDASGVKVEAPTGQYGVNWSLSGGGYIRREVRGLPDDYSRTANRIRLGWLYKMNQSQVTVAVDVAALPNTADNSAITCTDETADFNKLFSWDGMHDPEPDIFSYSVGGISGKFVFDNSDTPQVRLIPYQDILIQPVFTSQTDKKITGFTLTTNTGIVYTFDAAEQESRKSSPVSGLNNIFGGSYGYYTFQYNEPTVYNTGWHVSRIQSPSGGEITYTYGSEAYSYTDTVKVSIKKRNQTGYESVKLFTNEISGWKNYITQIRSSAGPLMLFLLADGVVTEIQVRDARDGDNDPSTSKLVKKFTLQYYSPDKKYLTSVQEISGAESLPPYKFSYAGYLAAGLNKNAQDFWGYFNANISNTDLFPQLYIYPDLPAIERIRLHPISGYTGTVYTLEGADRTVNPDVVKIGSLTRVQYPWGGSTTIEYEANTYYDEVASQNFYGPGIRVKKATYMDGANPDAKIIKTFVYANAQNQSWGVMFGKPRFAVPLWEHRSALGDLAYVPDEESMPINFQHMLARTDKDLSYDGASMGYKEVKVFRPGAGYAHYEYETPAAWGSAPTGEWMPAVNKLARYTDCPSAGIIQKLGTAMFPYAPDPDYDHERGLVKYKREYSEANVLVRQTYTTYQYLFKQGAAPFKVWGVRFDSYANADNTMYLFGKYFLLTDVSKVVDEETETLYDAGDISKSQSETVKYFYLSASHKLLSKVSRTTADGKVHTTNFKYPPDYGIVPAGSDKASEAIGTLQTTHRYGNPVEQYTIIEQPGAAAKVVSASVMKFNDFGQAGKALPHISYAWRTAEPVESNAFVSSYIHPTTKVFTIDSLYEPVATILAYDSLDKVASSIGENKIQVTSLWSTKLHAPVASITHAGYGQFAFSDFEAGTEASFTVQDVGVENTGVMRIAPGHTGTHGVYPEVKLSKVLSKASDSYLLTGWWNRYNTSLQISVTIQNTAKTTTFYNNVFTIQPSSRQVPWDFIEMKIPLNGVPSDFYIEVTFNPAGSQVPNIVPCIDDFAFYPSHASLTGFTYQFPYGQASVTSGDKTGYTVYDDLGRVKYMLDQDKNIVQKNTYQFTPSN